MYVVLFYYEQKLPYIDLFSLIKRIIIICHFGLNLFHMEEHLVIQVF